MNKKIIISTILFILACFGSIAILFNNGYQNQTAAVNRPGINSNEIILYYGDGCPHCAAVEDCIEKNNIKNKIPFVQKEVYFNQSNAKELEAKAKICGLSTDSIGVPFLWDGEKCFIGDQEIINFFKQKI